MSSLFTPIEIDGVQFPNRIAVAPMCQYMARDGVIGDWHMQQWMTYALSGAGMITMEATGVVPEGRITPGCPSLHNEATEAAMTRTLKAARSVAPTAKFGLQLAHAGRKASRNIQWEAERNVPEDEGGWRVVAPSPIPFTEGWQVPHALDDTEILGLIASFGHAASRARRAGFDFVEIHGAHGYLLHQFLSPLSNQRTDRWGGSLENRMRFIVEVAKAIKAAEPALMVGARLSVTEWVDGGFSPDEAVIVARVLKEAGVGYICASSGGNVLNARIPAGPHYQVHLAEKIKREAGIATRAVGIIDDPLRAEAIVADGQADIVAIARAILADPRWPWRAAAALGAPYTVAPPLNRAAATLNRWVEAGRPQAEAAE